MDKKELRKIIKERKRQYSSRQLEELSLSVLSRLDSNPHLQNAQTILMYYSLPDEVDTHHYIDQLVSRGKRVILPVVLDDTNMELREYTGVQDLKEGAYHILEPKGRIYPEEKYPEIELAVIPGMSFDMKGNRLGRGKGYYDRFLVQIPHAYKIGICFDFQKIKEEGLLPVTPTDICMDEII